MRLFLLAVLGDALGSGARHLVNIGAARLLGIGFPWGTFTVNIVGGFLMGLLIEALALKYQGSLELRTFFATGLLGGFTTFSAFTLDVVQMMEHGQPALAAAYALGSLVMSVLALMAGFLVARLIF